MIEAWVLDRKESSAALPPWLAAAVQNRTEDGLLTLASRAGIVEAGPGDLVMWDGERINVYCGHSRGACRASHLAESRTVSVKPFKAIGVERDREREATARRPSLAVVLAVMVFLGALAFGYAWLMIKLIGHARLHY